jgi:ribonuclease Z
MKRSTKILMITLLMLVIVVLVGKFVFDQFIASDRAIASGIERSYERNEEIAADLLDTDEINIVLVGTAGPMSPTEAQTATAVFVNGRFLLFDAGDYTQKRMEQLRFPMEALDAVFLTHFHNDHIADLGEVMQRSYILGREKDLVVYGPTGVDDIVTGFNMVYSMDCDHRTEHHGEEVMPSEFHFMTANEFDAELKKVVVYEKDGIVVTAFQNYHPPIEPTFGYIVEYAGKKVVISGDTLITNELTAYSKNADLLVMDIMNYELVMLMEESFRATGQEDLAIIMDDIREYHPDANDIGVMAQEQGVKRLALTHYAPSPKNDSIMKRFYVDPVKSNYKGELIAGGDGTTITIPLE